MSIGDIVILLGVAVWAVIAVKRLRQLFRRLR